MSIIEEAVRKNAERHRQSPPDPLRPQTRLRRVPAAPVDTSHAQRFQPITLDKAALHDGALHVNNTGFPWEAGSNVYIAGHRMGFPATKSYLVFWDLDKLENGDEVILTDANGTKYTYRVFDKFVVGPSDVQVMQPVAGRSVVSLQTCTLPDYSERLIVQAELASVS